MNIGATPVRAALVATAFLAVSGAAATAGAPSKTDRLPDRHFVGVRDAHTPRPGGGSTSSLSYHGGAVETVPVVYLSYWGSEWSTGFNTCDTAQNCYTSGQAQTYIDDFFANVGGSAWMATQTQYCQNAAYGATSCAKAHRAVYITNPANQLVLASGVWNDPTTVPAQPTQTDLADAAGRAAAHFGYNAGATYIILTPTQKSESGFGTSFCAWHSSTASSQGTIAYAYVPYLPDAGGACGRNFVNAVDDSSGRGFFDGFSMVAGHEYAEAVTDPQPSSGWINASGLETGDLCVWNAASANVTLGGTDYAVQPLWSNAANRGSGGCVLN